MRDTTHGSGGPGRILLTTAEFAEVVEVTLEVVEHWRKTGIGPAPVLSGRHGMYDLAEVQVFLTQHRAAKSERLA